MSSRVMSMGCFFLSFLIVAFGQPAWNPYLAPLAACIGYAIFWRFASQSPFSKKRFWTATVWFMAAQLVQLSWMTSIEFQGFYILGVYATLAIWLGLQFGLVTLFIDKIPLVATAAVWTLIEWARLHILCGFSWNPVGLTLTAFPLSLQAASLFGILGLSFLVFLTNLAFWKKKYPIAVTLAIFPYLFGWIHTSMHASKVEQSPTMTVGLVQTGLLPSEKILLPGRAEEFVSPYEQWRRIATLLKGCEKKIDLVVLPEFSVPFEAHSKVYSSSVVQQILDEINGKERSVQVAEAIKVSNQFWVQTIGKLMSADVIAGLDVTDQGNHFTSAYYCPHTIEKVERYDKQILVPLAEYVPFEWVRNLTKAYGITEFYTHGKEAKVFSSKVSFAPSICYEETFAHLMRKNRLKGANLFVNLSNDNWYPNSKLPQQHFDHARLRAVENGVPMVRACNTGITAAVDSLGRIIDQITDERRADVLVAQVPLYHYPTLYSFWGDFGIIGLSLIFILICGILNRKHLTINTKRS